MHCLGAIKLKELDVLDGFHPATEALLEYALKPRAFANSKLQDRMAEQIVRDFLGKAKEAKRWVPIVISSDNLQNRYANPDRGMMHLVKEGLVNLRELANGMKLFIPTENFYKFVQGAAFKSTG